MDMETFNRLLMESVGVGMAVIDEESHDILFFNQLFASWFPFPENDSRNLSDVLKIIDSDKLREDDGRFSGDIQIKVKRRSLTIAVSISRTQSDNDIRSALLVECNNVSKIKELEYMIESYAKLVEKNERQLRREKERAEKLLLNVMPKAIYEELRDYGVTTPVLYEEVSVLMLDFVDFTEMTVSSDPTVLVSELNDIFTAFDRIVEQFDCERIKTMGDAYMAVSGLPDPTSNHAHNIARAAILFRRYIRQRNKSSKVSWKCRIGIATGSVIGSMIGVQKYVYDIFGPGVNLAARMEAISQPMEITVCETTADLINDEFRLDQAPDADVKGFGRQKLFKLTRDSERPKSHELPGYLH
jgi:adenylate cyclase